MSATSGRARLAYESTGEGGADVEGDPATLDEIAAFVDALAQGNAEPPPRRDRDHGGLA